MSFWNRLKTKLQVVRYYLLILVSEAKILFCKVAKRVLLEVGKALSSFFRYARDHSNELICNLLITVIGSIIAGYILTLLA